MRFAQWVFGGLAEIVVILGFGWAFIKALYVS